MKAKNKKIMLEIQKFLNENMICNVCRAYSDDSLLIPVNHQSQPFTGKDVLITVSKYLESIGIDSSYSLGRIRWQYYPESWTIIIQEVN